MAGAGANESLMRAPSLFTSGSSHRSGNLPTPIGDYRACLECGLVTPDGERIGALRTLAG